MLVTGGIGGLDNPNDFLFGSEIFDPAAIDFVASLLPRPKRKRVRDTWNLIDARLGAFVRGQVLLILFVGTALSLLFWAIGEPFWLLIGPFAGLV